VSKPSYDVKRPTSALLAGPYGHPWHPILVTVPIGSWVASLVFDIGSYVVDMSAFLARGSVWLIAIGVLGAIVAASVGLLDFFTIPTGTPAFQTGLVHLVLNVGVTAAYVVNFLWRNASTAEHVPTGPLALSVVSLAILTLSGHLGGKLAFRYGVRVAAEGDQAEGFQQRR
jgi:uncharacterized membrane protein